MVDLQVFKKLRDNFLARKVYIIEQRGRTPQKDIVTYFITSIKMDSDGKVLLKLVPDPDISKPQAFRHMDSTKVFWDFDDAKSQLISEYTSILQDVAKTQEEG